MVYSGNKLINFNNITGIVLFALVVLFMAKDNEPLNETIWVGIPVLLFVLLLFILNAFYFEVTDEEVIIFNYVLPFIRIKYKLNEITEIRAQDSNNRGTTAMAFLRILRGNKKSMVFKAGSIGKNDWKDMINDLCSKQMNVVVSATALDGIDFDE